MTINGSTSCCLTRIRYKHKSNKSNGKDPPDSVKQNWGLASRACCAGPLSSRCKIFRVDSLYVNAVSAIGIVSEPNVAVNVDQPDSQKQVAVVCSAD